MTNKDKRDLAESFFLHSSMTQQEIAARVGVSENTLTKWKTDGDWEVKRGAKTATKSQIITSCYQQIDLIRRGLTDANGKTRVMLPAETQTVSMISKVIERLDKKMSIDTYIQVMEEFSNHVFGSSPDRAKDLITLQDAFIQTKFAEIK